MSTIASQSSSRLTAVDLLAMPNETDFELVNGQLEANVVGFEAVRIATRLSMFLTMYCDKMKLGWVLGSDVGYQCFAPDEQRVRRPDVSFISLLKIPLDHAPMGYIRMPPDLAVEVVSPHDLAEEVNTKINDYRDAGVPLIWVFYPSSSQVCVYQSSGPQLLSSEDELSGQDVLPGFRMKVSDLFAKFSA